MSWKDSQQLQHSGYPEGWGELKFSCTCYVLLIQLDTTVLKLRRITFGCWVHGPVCIIYSF